MVATSVQSLLDLLLLTLGLSYRGWRHADAITVTLSPGCTERVHHLSCVEALERRRPMTCHHDGLYLPLMLRVLARRVGMLLLQLRVLQRMHLLVA